MVSLLNKHRHYPWFVFEKHCKRNNLWIEWIFPQAHQRSTWSESNEKKNCSCNGQIETELHLQASQLGSQPLPSPSSCVALGKSLGHSESPFPCVKKWEQYVLTSSLIFFIKIQWDKQIDEKKSGSSDILFSWAPKSLWMMPIATKLKDTFSLEEKLWQT